MAINSPLGSAAPKLGKSLISSSVFSAPIAAPKMQSSKLLDIDTDQLKTNVDRVDDIVALENRVATNEKKITITKNILKLQQQNRTKVNESLSEVNNILTDIGSALALDFANRISNEQEEAKEQSAERQKKKVKKEESFLEKTRNKVSEKITSTASAVMKPVQGIFERLKSFALTVGAGILANAALTWLQNPENRQKLMGIFDILKEHWKWVLAGIGVFLALPLIGFVSGIVGTFAGLLPLLSPLLGVMVPLLPILAKAALIAGGLVLAGVAIKEGVDKVREEGFFGMGGTGGEDFSAAHDQLNEQLNKAGLDKKGNLLPNSNRRGPGQLTPEQEKIKNEVLKKREALEKLRDNMREERDAVVVKRSAKRSLNAQQKRRGFSASVSTQEDKDRAEAERQAIYQKAVDQIPGIMGRKVGGSMSKGLTYMVGENGPELFQPDIAGTMQHSTRTKELIKTIGSNEGGIEFITMDLPPIKAPAPEISTPSPRSNDVEIIDPVNIGNAYMTKTPEILGMI